MRKTNTELKIKREMLVGEYFARAKGLKGKLVNRDKPDIDYHFDSKIIEIGLTELAPRDSKTRLPRQRQVVVLSDDMEVRR